MLLEQYGESINRYYRSPGIFLFAEPLSVRMLGLKVLCVPK